MQFAYKINDKSNASTDIVLPQYYRITKYEFLQS